MNLEYWVALATSVPAPIGSPTPQLTVPNWFFSPGFGGLAVIIAAVIAYFAARRQAQATIYAQQLATDASAARESAQRRWEDDGARHDLQHYLIDVVREGGALFVVDSSSQYDSFYENCRALSERARQPDVPRALSLPQLSALGEAVSHADYFVRTKESYHSFVNRPGRRIRTPHFGFNWLIVRLFLWPAMPTHELTHVEAGMAAVFAARALHLMDLSDGWKAEACLTASLLESSLWRRYYDAFLVRLVPNVSE